MMPKPHYSPDHDACGVGFVTQLAGHPSHELVDRALTALLRLAHRGGVDADGRSGDGAGLLMAIPDQFMRACAAEQGIRLTQEFGLGMVFMPAEAEASVSAVVGEWLLLEVYAPGFAQNAEIGIGFVNLPALPFHPFRAAGDPVRGKRPKMNRTIANVDS